MAKEIKLLKANSDGNDVSKAGVDPDRLVGEFVEILRIVGEFEILYDETTVTEWVRVEIVAIGEYRRRKARLPEIDFTHVEVEEEIPLGLVETIEAVLAESLFNLWLQKRVE